MISTLLLSLLLAAPQCQTFETTLYAGQSIAIGTVSVSNTTEQLIIDLDVPFPWFFGAYHIYAGAGSLPVNGGGNVAPGQFPFAHAFTGKTRSYTVVIDENDLGVSLDNPVDLLIAVHLEAYRCSGGQVGQTETAWAFGDAFSGSQWGWSFHYTTCSTGFGSRADLGLDVDQLRVGSTSTMTATGAAAGEMVYFAFNNGILLSDAGFTNAGLGGLHLDLGGIVSMAGTALTDANGVAELAVAVPTRYAAQASSIIGLQAVILRGSGGVDSLKSNVRLMRLVN